MNRAAMACADIVAEWDAGETVRTVEMGGISPGYEQAIQILWIELLRDYHDKPLPETLDAWQDWGDDTVRRCNEACLGFSGAQVGAAKSLAARMLTIGYRETLDEVKARDGDDRLTMVSRHFPRPPELPAVVR